MLIAPKVAEVIKNTLATLAPVYTNNIQDSDNPIRDANIQKTAWAFEKLIFQVETPLFKLFMGLTLRRMSVTYRECSFNFENSGIAGFSIEF